MCWLGWRGGLGVTLEKFFGGIEDERPLLAAGTPEVREYRMRLWDKGTPNGD